MTKSPLWREFETGDNVLLKLLRFMVLAGGTAFLLFAAVLELTWPQQVVLGLMLVTLAIWINRSSKSYVVTLMLMLFSCFCTLRYAYWRVTRVGRFLWEPGTHRWETLDGFFVCLMLAAECYAFTILFMGFLQTLWPLRRTPVPLPEDTDLWPAVDLLIPTINEPLNVVRYTALAALNIDWPADKLNVYILDDGRREEFRAFAEEAGVGYMTRDSLQSAKAGNINHALRQLDAPYVAIFDADHVPTRSFLQLTMGWFERDERLGLLQTPHHFYSPDPFERNLNQFRTIPNEGELFYGVVQDGNDFWNATFFCGSCAVMRRTALDEVGGIAVDTVTEDAHTSLRMQMRRWNTAYINIPQAAGLATEQLSGHVRQRIRWARGMIQILRLENPLFAPGLDAAQRLCYFNAMSHFLYALPRMIFLTAPLVYLILGRTNIPGYWAAVLAFAFPHLILASLTNSRIQGQHRHSFWNEIYETVLAPYIFLPTMLALLNPKLGSFNVTVKGGTVARGYFDRRIAQPFLVMLGLNVVGLLCAIPRYVQFPGSAVHGILGVPARMYDGTHAGTISMNAVWAIFNIVVLGVATAVAWESQQRRTAVRVPMAVPAGVVLADGTVVQGVTHDLSSGGVMIQLDEVIEPVIGDPVRLIFPVLDGDATLPATIVGTEGQLIRAHFDPLTVQEEEVLTLVLYSRADTWLGWGEAREQDEPLQSLWNILQLSAYGLRQALQRVGRRPQRRTSSKFTAGATTVLLALLMVGRAACAERGYVPRPESGASGRVTAPTFRSSFTLTDLGARGAIQLRGAAASRTIHFAVPQTEFVKVATLSLRYHVSPSMVRSLSHLTVSVNGTMVATLPAVSAAMSAGIDSAAPGQAGGLLTAELEVPAELLVHTNELTIGLAGHDPARCEDPVSSAVWAHIDPESRLELAGELLPLANDLKLLPLPFYDAGVNLRPEVPIVFLSQPSSRALEAAGIVASYFGVLAADRPMRFPVSFGAIPAGDAIVISESAADLPPGLRLTESSGPTLAMRTNPGDAYGKLLVVTGSNAEELLVAAKVLALGGSQLLSTDQQRVSLHAPGARRADDAPRWLPTDRVASLAEFARTGELQTDGSEPVKLYFRVAPDLYYGTRQNVPFEVKYRYDGVPLGKGSTLQMQANGAYTVSVPMPPTSGVSANLSTLIPVPVVDMRPFSNSLLLRFAFLPARPGPCGAMSSGGMEGAVLRSSYLDLRGLQHWATLPNLELFANAGYPFTRMADLAETGVVLPDTPEPEEIELFLALMGHFGAQTGYPVLNVGVTDAEGMRSSPDRDFLLLGTVEDEADAMRALHGRLPVQVTGSGVSVQDPGGLFYLSGRPWWKVRSADTVQEAGLLTSNGLPAAIVEGLESPLQSGRSVVLVVLRDKSVLPEFLTAFLGSSQSGSMAQSVSVLHGSQFVSYQIGSEIYHVGSLSWWTRLDLLFSNFPWLLVAVIAVFCFLMAGLLRVALRRHARRRLQPVALSKD